MIYTSQCAPTVPQSQGLLLHLLCCVRQSRARRGPLAEKGQSPQSPPLGRERTPGSARGALHGGPHQHIRRPILDVGGQISLHARHLRGTGQRRILHAPPPGTTSQGQGSSLRVHGPNAGLDLPSYHPGDSSGEEASDTRFDWDQTLRLSTRTRAALALLIEITDQLGDAGQPISAPVSLVTDFMRWNISSTGSPHRPDTLSRLTVRVGMVHTHSPCSDPVLLHGQWASAPSLTGAAWMAQPCFAESGMPQDLVHILMGLHAASQRFPLNSVTLVIRTQCSSGARLMRRSCPAGHRQAVPGSLPSAENRAPGAPDRI